MGAASYAAYRKAGSPSLEKYFKTDGASGAGQSIYKDKNTIKNSNNFQNPSRYNVDYGIRNDGVYQPSMQRRDIVTMRNNSKQADWPANEDSYLKDYAQKDYNTRGPGGTYILRWLKDPYYNGNWRRFNPVQRSKIEGFTTDIEGYQKQVVVGKTTLFEPHQSNDSFNPELGIYQYTVKRGSRKRQQVVSQ